MIQEQQQQQQNMTEELTGDTLTEFLQLLNEEDFSNAILYPKTIDLSFLQKKETWLQIQELGTTKYSNGRH